MHSGFQFVFGQVARPDDYYLPTGIHQFIVVPLVAFAVTVNLGLPEGGVGLGQYKLFASLVNKEFYVRSANSRAALTPQNVHCTFLRCGLTASSETAVDENSRSVSAHHYVRLARHALDIEPVTVAVRPEPFPDQNLRLGRLAADMRHAAVALGGCEDVGHVSLV